MQISFSRKDHLTKGEQISPKYKKEIIDLLNYNYKVLLDQHKIKKKIDIYSQVYDSELLLIISLLDDDEKSLSSITCFTSIDLKEKKEYEKYLYRVLDFVGLILESILDKLITNQDLEKESIIDYCENWLEEEFHDLKIFYKISRENVALTLQANKLLS
ncbi:MAG: hypothetical protein HQK51_00600 [Oligoflexia bacterium]|nr:hypothetical protein [Oligoflexia bacterium]